MKKLESSLTNMVIVLTLIAIIAGGALAYVNDFTAPQIEKINKENLDAGFKSVMGSDDFKVADPVENGGFTCYAVNDADGNSLGSAITTTENGFGGPMKVLVGFDNEGVILGYTVLEHAETPGLGAKADTWFQKGQKGDIIGKNPGKDIFKVSKDVEGGIDAITASTITSRAFLLAIEKAYNEYFSAGAEAVSGATAHTEADGDKCGECDKEECGKTECDGECEGGCDNEGGDECNEEDCDKQDCKKTGCENKTSFSIENK